MANLQNDNPITTSHCKVHEMANFKNNHSSKVAMISSILLAHTCIILVSYYYVDLSDTKKLLRFSIVFLFFFGGGVEGGEHTLKKKSGAIGHELLQPKCSPSSSW